MKILHTQKINKIAGSENYLLNFLPELVKNNFIVTFLILFESGEEEEILIFKRQLEQQGIKVLSFGFKEKLFPFYLKKLQVLIASEKPDIVNSHLIHADFLTAWVKLLFKPKWKLISGRHGYDQPYQAQYGFNLVFNKRKLYRYMATFSAWQLDGSYFISKGLRNLYNGLNIKAKKEIQKVIYYGMDFPLIESENNTYRYSKNQIILVGRLTAVKGHLYAFDIIEKVQKVIPDICLLLLGGGELENELKNKAKDKTYIHFLGFQNNAREFIRNSDILISTSISEGLGLTVLEAFSQKKTAITFNVPAINELITNESDGYVIEPFNTSKFAEEIIYLLKNKTIANLMGISGYKKYKEQFNMNKMTQETVAFYKTIIKD